jgi:hypothetical protein
MIGLPIIRSSTADYKLSQLRHHDNFHAGRAPQIKNY